MNHTRVSRIENALIRTMADSGPATAHSIDLAHDRIEALDVPRHQRGPAQQQAQAPQVNPSQDLVLDARGAVVVPGLIDCHQHTLMGGLALAQLNLSTVRSRAEFEEAIAARSAQLEDREWLEAWGWQETNWSSPSSEVPALPDRTWLRACGDRPAVCWRSDHHVCVVNDAVLSRLAESGLLTQDPPGGRIDRDSAGRPTGLLLEAAAWTLVRPLVPAPSLQRRRQALSTAQAHLCSLGLTTVMSMEYAADVEQVLLPDRDAMRPRMIATLLDRQWPFPASGTGPQAWALARALASESAAHPAFSILGFKAFLDGTLGSRTAAMLEPYSDAPDLRGILVELAEQDVLGEWIATVSAAGFSPSMHAIGDAALRLALDAIDTLPSQERALARIEHAQTVHPIDVPRTANRRLSMQPLHRADDGRVALGRLGASRMNRFFPFRTLLDAGAILGFGSDWPIVSADPLAGMRSAITGLTTDGEAIEGAQCLSPSEALAAYTREAARLLQTERTGLPRGELRPGAAADLVILDSDPLHHDWRRSSPRVLATIVGGTLVHCAPT